MPEYDFNTLSPVDFEILTADILNAELGVHVESFGPGKDKGVDLRCSVSGGNVVIQCKHYPRGGRTALRRAVEKEAQKWVNARGVKRYVLVTSVSMTVELKEELASTLGKFLPVTTADVLGQEDLNALLLRHPEVELRHFKLWTASVAVLSRIIHSGLWNRTEELLESIENRSKFYVITDHFSRTMEVLKEHNICVVTGSPGVGKSILAEMILLAHWREDWQVVQISEDVKEGFEAWNPNHPQIFYYDDFLGQTDLAETTGKNEDHRIAQFAERVRRAAPGTKRFILTTREQIFRHAQERSDRIRRARSALVPTEVRVEDYSDYTKALIFYNHLHFSDLSEADRRTLVENRAYGSIISHENYSPRILEQVLRRRSESLSALLSNLRASLDDPSELWASSYHHLSDTGRKILTILVTHPPRGIAESALRKYVHAADPYAYTQALKVLDGTWVTISSPARNAHQTVALANPSCRDFLLHELNASPALAEATLGEVQDIEQVLMLLRYSGLDKYRKARRSKQLSTAWDKLEYTRFLRDIRNPIRLPLESSYAELKEILVENSGRVMSDIRHLYGERAAQWSSDDRKNRGKTRFIVSDPRPEMLATVMNFVMSFGGPEDVAWCQAEAWNQTRSEDKLPDATVEAYVTLALTVQNYAFSSAELVDGLLKRALEDFYDPADVELFFDIFDPQDHGDAMRDVMYSSFMRFADSEFEHWHYESDYGLSREAADFVEKFAEKFDAPVQEMLESWRQSADEYEAEEEEARSYAESPHSWSASGNAPRDTGLIAELFQTLLEE
ncbi:restriction endonuclease [Streptomyces sp. MBT62]|uniref:nSTAND3 domain-containing NTPase n=1 Tax=Streptomyces sp. MBT62 TaxID=2800410 RepID=UPI0019099C8F|nr:restriction endonuclease [Streptomyces sp. MBT62]MBK3569856.1 restriction endonuclease [Streptomyces sp. MBT62]